MKVSIICPVYNGECFLEGLHDSLMKQKNVQISSIEYVMTEGEDNTEEVLKKLDCKYIKIKKSEFSHSITREEASFRADGEILVFITQDIKIEDDLWLYYLITPIIEGKCVASFSRQVCIDKTIEKYVREKNYPLEARIKSIDDIDELGIKTFYFSDASSAIRKDIFVELKGYDNKNLLTNEDMYIAYKIIMAGYKIRYSPESWVIHSHNLTMKEQYKRYYDTGIFLGENSYMLDYNAKKAGMGLLEYVVKRSLKEKNYKAFINIIPNFGARYLGDFFGKRKGKKNFK